jgi:hypothetical protein
MCCTHELVSTCACPVLCILVCVGGCVRIMHVSVCGSLAYLYAFACMRLWCNHLYVSVCGSVVLLHAYVHVCSQRNSIRKSLLLNSTCALIETQKHHAQSNNMHTYTCLGSYIHTHVGTLFMETLDLNPCTKALDIHAQNTLIRKSIHAQTYPTYTHVHTHCRAVIGLPNRAQQRQVRAARGLRG